MTSAVPEVGLTNAGRLVDLVKPRMRGWLHAYAAIISLVTGACLATVAAVLGSTNAGWSTSVYAATVSLLFGTSALYHRRGWSPRAHQLMNLLDHSMIFIFIAGTYTPFAAL